MSSIHYQTDLAQLITGDSRTALNSIPAGSVDCVVTSPPYFGLRDYDHAQQIGQDTMRGYVDDVVSVLRSVSEVMSPMATLWLNVGDTYQSSGGTVGIGKNASVGSTKREGSKPRIRVKTGLPDKNLLGIPWRLAFALQDDGWILRSEIIWEKPNAMPESVRDRVSRSFEYIFMLTRNKKYHYNAAAMREPRTDGKGDRAIRNVWRMPVSPPAGAHFATFPVELPRKCIRAGCPEGGLVLDPFSGSATTGVAALEMGRKYVGLDLNPSYHEIGAKRLDQVHPTLF